MANQFAPAQEKDTRNSMHACRVRAYMQGSQLLCQGTLGLGLRPSAPSFQPMPPVAFLQHPLEEFGYREHTVAISIDLSHNRCRLILANWNAKFA